MNEYVFCVFFFGYIYGLFCLYLIGQLRADRKALGEGGGGSAKDLETGIELGSPRAQLRRHTNHWAIGADMNQRFE